MSVCCFVNAKNGQRTGLNPLPSTGISARAAFKRATSVRLVRPPTSDPEGVGTDYARVAQDFGAGSHRVAHDETLSKKTQLRHSCVRSSAPLGMLLPFSLAHRTSCLLHGLERASSLQLNSGPAFHGPSPASAKSRDFFALLQHLCAAAAGSSSDGSGVDGQADVVAEAGPPSCSERCETRHRRRQRCERCGTRAV